MKTDLKPLHDLMEKATKGPISIQRTHYYGKRLFIAGNGPEPDEQIGIICGEEQAELFAEAVNALPALIEELTALREFVEEVRGINLLTRELPTGTPFPVDFVVHGLKQEFDAALKRLEDKLG